MVLLLVHNHRQFTDELDMVKDQYHQKPFQNNN